MMYRYLCLGLLLVSLSGCFGKKRISLENLLPTQLESVPIGLTFEQFGAANDLSKFQRTEITKSIFYLKKSFDTEILFIQYQFDNNVLSEVIIGYSKNFAAEDVAIKLYGQADEKGLWYAKTKDQNVIIQIFDNTIIYR